MNCTSVNASFELQPQLNQKAMTWHYITALWHLCCYHWNNCWLLTWMTLAFFRERDKNWRLFALAPKCCYDLRQYLPYQFVTCANIYQTISGNMICNELTFFFSHHIWCTKHEQSMRKIMKIIKVNNNLKQILETDCISNSPHCIKFIKNDQYTAFCVNILMHEQTFFFLALSLSLSPFSSPFVCLACAYNNIRFVSCSRMHKKGTNRMKNMGSEWKRRPHIVIISSFSLLSWKCIDWEPLKKSHTS